MLTTIALTLSLVFNGGDVSDFALRYAAETHRGVVVGAERPLPAFQVFVPFDWDAEGYKHAAGYVGERIAAVPSMVESVNVKGWYYQAYRPKALPIWLAPGWSEATFGAYDVAFPAVGRVLETTSNQVVVPACPPGKYRTGESIELSKFSKPVKVHWLLKHYRFAAAGSFSSEEDFLRCVSTAIGGKLRVATGGYEIDLDPAAYRQELIAYLKDDRGGLGATDYFHVAYVDYQLAVLNALSDAQIAHAMATEHSYVTVEIPQNSFAVRCAAALVEAFLYEGTNPSSRDRRVNAVHRQLLDYADSARPFLAYFSALRGIKLRLRTVEAGGAIEL